MAGHTATEVVVISVRLFLALVLDPLMSTPSWPAISLCCRSLFFFLYFFFVPGSGRGGAARSGPFRNHPDLFSATDHWLDISTSGHGSLAIVILGSSAFQGLLALVQRSLQDRWWYG